MNIAQMFACRQGKHTSVNQNQTYIRICYVGRSIPDFNRGKVKTTMQPSFIDTKIPDAEGNPLRGDSITIRPKSPANIPYSVSTSGKGGGTYCERHLRENFNSIVHAHLVDDRCNMLLY